MFEGLPGVGPAMAMRNSNPVRRALCSSLLLIGICAISTQAANSAPNSGLVLDLGQPSVANLSYGIDLSDTSPLRGPCISVQTRSASAPTAPGDPTAFGDTNITYVRSEYALNRAKTISASASGGGGIPFVDEVKFHASADDSTTSQFEQNSVFFVYSRSYISQDFGQNASITALPNIPPTAAAWAENCGTKYISGFVNGAHIGVVIAISNVSNDERASLEISGGLNAVGTFDEGIQVSGAASGLFRNLISSHFASNSVQVSSFALGSPALVLAIQNLSFAGVKSYDDITSALNNTVTAVARAGPISGPVAYKLSNYPPSFTTQQYVRRSDRKATALTLLSAAASKTAALRAHARAYQHLPWSVLGAAPEDKVAALRAAFNELQASYQACNSHLITELVWDSPTGPPDCGEHQLYDALNLTDSPTFGFAEPGPISAQWQWVGVGPMSTGATFSTTNVNMSDGVESRQYLEFTNAYLKRITLRLDSSNGWIAAHNVIYFGHPPGASGSSSSARLPLNVAHSCGGCYWINQIGGLPNLAYFHGVCKQPSIRDFVQGFMLAGGSIASANVYLDVTTSFGQQCTWQVSNWSLGFPFINFTMYGPFDTSGCVVK